MPVAHRTHYLSHAVLWGSGGIVDLGDLDPLWPAISAAYGINDAGQVVGGSYDDLGEFSRLFVAERRDAGFGHPGRRL